jgi:cob(I)alamin adenosyltransferase
MEGRGMTERPRILLFTGDGKGKTTAALGMALRAAGHGRRSCVVQFVKTDATVGEVRAAESVGAIQIVQTGRGFLPPVADPAFALHRRAAQAGLRTAADIIAQGDFRVVILDEICLAVARGLVDEQQVADLLDLAPPTMCLVLTGRDATPGLVALADTVTEMRCVKHAFQQGRAAEEGVER